MKILVISNLYPPDAIGGYERGCAQVVGALRERGHEVVVCTGSSYLGSPEENGILRNLHLADLYRPVALRSDVRLLDDTKAKVVNFHNISIILDVIYSFRPTIIYFWNLLGLGMLGIVSAIDYIGIPWVWHLMDRIPTVIRELPSPSLETLFESASTGSFAQGTFILVSSILLEECRSAKVDLGDRTFILPTWASEADCPPVRSVQNGAPLRCLYAGVMEEYKGIGLIVEAAKLLKQNGRRKFEIDLYGRDGEAYKFMADRTGVSDQVHFYAPVTSEELRRQYLNHDVFLFPTRYREPNAFVVFEAAAAGCVPIMSNICGNAEWLVDKVHVIKIDRSAESLADALESIMDGTTELAGLSRRVSNVVSRDFVLNKIVLKIERILEGREQPFLYDAQRWKDAKLLYNLLDKTATQMVSS